jgi:hypothetical protein
MGIAVVNFRTLANNFLAIVVVILSRAIINFSFRSKSVNNDGGVVEAVTSIQAKNIKV